jgi:hypothetical protein
MLAMTILIFFTYMGKESGYNKYHSLLWLYFKPQTNISTTLLRPYTLSRMALQTPSQ